MLIYCSNSKEFIYDSDNGFATSTKRVLKGMQIIDKYAIPIKARNFNLITVYPKNKINFDPYINMYNEITNGLTLIGLQHILKYNPENNLIQAKSDKLITNAALKNCLIYCKQLKEFKCPNFYNVDLGTEYTVDNIDLINNTDFGNNNITFYSFLPFTNNLIFKKPTNFRSLKFGNIHNAIMDNIITNEHSDIQLVHSTLVVSPYVENYILKGEVISIEDLKIQGNISLQCFELRSFSNRTRNIEHNCFNTIEAYRLELEEGFHCKVLKNIYHIVAGKSCAIETENLIFDKSDLYNFYAYVHQSMPGHYNASNRTFVLNIKDRIINNSGHPVRINIGKKVFIKNLKNDRIYTNAKLLLHTNSSIEVLKQLEN